ncbi:MAG: CPBP family intramembrane glutamic endopeptidase, partial [Acidimicrobiia bacterium]
MTVGAGSGRRERVLERDELEQDEMVWRWCRWTRWPLTPAIVAVAALTVVFDVGTAWLGFNLGQLGRVPISPTLPIELVLALMVGLRRLGLDRANLMAWREFLVVSGAALLFGVWQYSSHIGGFREAMGLVLAALDEELVYRLAVMILVGAACAKLAGRNWRNSEDWGALPGVVAILASGFVFALLPGHVAQMTDTLHALPFVCLGMVLGYAVLRTGALFPAAVVHALLNLATIAAFSGEIST